MRLAHEAVKIQAEVPGPGTAPVTSPRRHASRMPNHNGKRRRIVRWKRGGFDEAVAGEEKRRLIRARPTRLPDRWLTMSHAGARSSE
jgi:hypothetical protein